MQIVIDIPKQDYIYIAKKHCLPSCDDRTLRKNIYEMIVNGTPLEQEQKTGWIPVSERLPEDGDVLVTVLPRWGLFNVKVIIAHYSKLVMCEKPCFYLGKEFGRDFKEITKRVVAWMPLPSPYKAESEDRE